MIMKKRITIISLLTISVKNINLFIVNGLMLCILTAAYSLICPKTYQAKTTILPPADNDIFNVGSILNNLPAGLGIGGVTSGSNIYIAIFNSRTNMESIANKFNLQERFGEETMEAAVRTLRSLAEILMNDDGSLSLTVKAGTPFFPTTEDENDARKLATDMANSFIETVEQINIALKIEKAQKNREYIERRYLQNLDDLKTTEDSLTAFQKRTGAIALPEQVSATIAAVADLQAEIISMEVEADLLASAVAKNHPQLSMLQNKIQKLNSNLKGFFVGKQGIVEGNQKELTEQFEIFVAVEKMPEYGMEFARLYRELKLQEALQQFILPLYEQAKIEAAKDLPTVQIIDTAVPPVLRHSPKRSLMVLTAGIISIAFTLLYLLSLDFLQKLKENQTGDYDELVTILNNLEIRIQKAKKRLLFRS